MKIQQKITPFLSFNTQAEEAANFYVSLFPDSKIERTTKNPATGAVMTVEYQLAGLRFIALNVGQEWEFTHAFSLSVACESQEEIDRLWNELSSDGGQEVHCGWLTDKFGVSWQIVPANVADLIGGDAERAGRVMDALLQMKKLDMAKLQAAYDG